MRYDKPLYAASAGIIGGFVYEIYCQIFRLILGIPKYSAFEIHSMMFVGKPSWLVGSLTVPLTGILVGFIIYQLTKLYGSDYLWIKGGIISMFVWASVEMILTLVKHSIIIKPIDHIIVASGSFVAGIFIGAIISKWVMRVSSPH